MPVETPPKSGGGSFQSTAPNYSAAQLAQMYNAANAASSNPQPITYSVGSKGNLVITQGASGTSPGSSGSSIAAAGGSAGASGGSSGSGSGKGTSGSGSSGQLTITQNPPATGYNDLPGWIAAGLNNGTYTSWTNPKTGQTFYAPGAVAPAGEGIWVSGPGESGPINGYFYNPQTGGYQAVTITGSTTTISQNGKPVWSGSTSNAPVLKYSATGAFEGLQAPPYP
ncbi:MAG: hypothetical protein QXS81_04710, partial [Candidatus Micrarchaeaceae archaeon]